MTDVVDDDLPILITGEQAAILAHVAPSTIRVWQLRGKLRPVGRDTDRRHLYDLADIGPLTRDETRETAGMRDISRPLV